ncbi:MAG: hypothetical protein MJ158_03930 [Alphaproteobacteria bacterium]|nr:hypothetical protein [Alphaproteobacteria bacterium]
MTNKQYIKNMLKTAGYMLLEPQNWYTIAVIAGSITIAVALYNKDEKSYKNTNTENFMKQLEKQKKQNLIRMNFSKQR